MDSRKAMALDVLLISAGPFLVAGAYLIAGPGWAFVTGAVVVAAAAARAITE